jgi:hypothetical protein
MAGPNRRRRPVLGLVGALVITLGWAAAPAPADAALPAWNGGINLYRTGVFTTQKSWLWCTAAGVQIMRNIKYHREDHSRANQSRYFSYMRARNRYSLPLSAGVDPQGWTAGLRHYVDDRYRLTSSSTFVGALRLAVLRMRLTNLPVALAVARGNHGWVLHGFTATADPARTAEFRITSVRVSGPLWGLQNSSFGYDMPPNKKLFPYELKRFFTPWWYAPKRMIWDGRYVSIQPVPFRSSTSSAAAAAAAQTEPSPAPTATSPITPGPDSSARVEATSVAPAVSPARLPAAVNEPVALGAPATPLLVALAILAGALGVVRALASHSRDGPRSRRTGRRSAVGT